MARRSYPFSPVDAAWLHMDEPTNLMMITGVLMFDTPLDFARLRELIERRLLRFDRFRMRLADPNLRSRSPRWLEDPHFNLRSHLHRISLPSPGGQAALQELVSDLMSTPLDYTKPLWQFHVVENFGSGGAIIARLHHAIADGIALVRVLLSLTDDAPDGDLRDGPDEAQGDGRAPLLQPLQRTAQLAAQVGEALGALGDPERLAEGVRLGIGGAEALNKLLFMAPDPPTPLKGQLGVEKRAAWSQPVPLDDIKAVGRMARGTVNDVLINAVAGALRRYLLRRGAPVAGLNIRAVVPVNLRPPDEPIGELGNRFGVVFLALPLGIADPLDRLLELKRRMEAIKGSPEAVLAFGLLHAIGIAPLQIADLAVDLFGQKATAVMTNVPGPRAPLYLAGSRVDKVMFWVPQSGHLGLGVSIFSYAGAVLLGVAADAGLVPDPEAIVADFHAELDELIGLARIVEGVAPAASISVGGLRPSQDL
ncbi:MAG: wax ester/triacylglycerol synthase family O-acyltransferase [Chloroflexota bacterium]|mgnify:CR=1 FL=1|nr:MAG: wax ester/triacylglycerol synthase family O-acyltransferase [Chloroflexota bacterium]